MTRSLAVLLITGVFLAAYPCCGQNITGYGMIPDPFLFLLREPAVQEDLGLSDQQQKQLVALNERFDGDLLASRGQPPETSRETVERVKQQSLEGVAQIFTKQQRDRLDEITYRLRGISLVLIPRAAEELELTSAQRSSIEKIVTQTQEDLDALRQQLSSDDLSPEETQKNEREIREREQRQILAQLEDEQQQRLRALIGREFDLSQLGRVSFRAPELSDSGIWINSEELKLSQLHGKVIALHFWAFG